MRELAPIALHETETAFHLSGGTWECSLSKVTGLLERAATRGDHWLATPLPDLWASEAVDPRADRFQARHATAQVRLVSVEASRVILESVGGFAKVDGSAIPLARRLRFTFDADGTVQVDVSVEARGALLLRWLSLGQNEVDPASCRFLAHEGDAAEGFATARPACHAVGEGDLDLGGRFIPWIHFGNDRGGFEVVFPHSDRVSWGWTDTSPYPTGDPLGRAGEGMVIRVASGRPSWEAFAIRNLRTPVDEGWKWSDTFYLSLLPGAMSDPRANDLRVWWLGPHQYRSGWHPPDEKSIAAWAAAGANLVIGGANWRSGDYSHPERPADLDRFIELCHRYGMRVLPYVTFTDLEFGTPAFAAHAEEWRIEPVAEFNYRSHLMCYGAEGWQEHWEREVSAAWERHAFDGLYIDFWAGRLLCRNERHGCAGPYGRCTAPGLRRMARYAADLVRKRQGLIIANTNILPLGMLNSSFDARLLGEWRDPEEADPLSQRVFYNAHRFGCANLLLTGKLQSIDERALALTEAYQGTPVLSGGRTPDERDLLSRRARLLASFGVGAAHAENAFELPPLPGAPGVRASIYRRHDRDECLVTLSNPGAEDVRVPLTALVPLCGPLAGRMVVCVEATRVFTASELSSSEGPTPAVDVPAGSLRTLWIRPDPGAPCLIYALTGRERPSAEWSQEDHALSFTSEHPSLSTAEVLLAGPEPIGIAGDAAVEFQVGIGCVRAEVPCNVPVVASYPPPRLAQLKMRFTRFDRLPEARLPEGYEVRAYRPGDEAAWAAILNATESLGKWDVDRVVRLLQGQRHAVPEGTFFVTWKGLPVATATTVIGPGNLLPEVGWVGVVPAHQGHRLAFHVCLAVLRYMRDRGFQETYLLTDDFRLPAIKTYLRLGFEPEIADPSHPARWQRILSEIG